MRKDLLGTIKKRRSVRKFKKKKIPQGALNKILDAGRFSPSGLNNQPWRFIIVRGKETRHKIAGLTRYSSVFKNADVIIVVLLDKKESYNLIKDMQATGACIQNMLLEAHSLGLGACWQGQILNNEKKVFKTLNLDKKRYVLCACVVLGYPAVKPKKFSRKPLKKLIIAKY